MTAAVEMVREFWNANPCGSRLVEDGDIDRYFEAHRAARYRVEPHIFEVARFSDYAGKDVLEVGCGIGADGLEFAKAGARYTGFDLTPKAVEMTKLRFERAGYKGRFECGDAGKLPFPDHSFDHIYSFGVIHHSPHTEQIVQEMLRVLRPGGTVCVMVYNRTSLNYKAQIMFLRKIARWAMVPPGTPQIYAAMTGIDVGKLRRHRELVFSKPRMTHDEWVSINTDGPDCPLAKVYDRREATALFTGFEELKHEVYYLDRRLWPGVGPRLSDETVERLGRKWGWHRVIRARKPR